MKNLNKSITLLLLWLFLACCSSSVLANASPELYLVWQQQPITIALPLKSEKAIKFVNPVAVGLPISLKDKLSVSNKAGEVTFTTQKPFPSTRVEVKDTVTGNVLILILSANDQGSTAGLSILYKAPSQTYSPDSEGWLETPNALKGEMAYVTLTRYAEQQLYAPKRLQKDPFGIQLINSYLLPNGGINPTKTFHSLFYDASTINIPWASWRGGNTYVTAVVVKNALSTPLILTKALPLLCGHDDGIFKAVTFFPSWRLSKAGTLHDTTVAFLVSTVPFEQAQRFCEVAHVEA